MFGAHRNERSFSHLDSHYAGWFRKHGVSSLILPNDNVRAEAKHMFDMLDTNKTRSVE